MIPHRPTMRRIVCWMRTRLNAPPPPVCSRRPCMQRLVRTSPLPLFTAACTICGIFCALHMAACPCAADCRSSSICSEGAAWPPHSSGRREPLAADCANREHRPWQSANGERTESFGDLFDAAVPLAVSLQRAVLDRYFQDKPLDPRFFPSDFNGNPVKNGK